MNTSKTYVYASSIAFICGVIFFCVYHELIIFRAPSFMGRDDNAHKTSTYKKTVFMWYWYQNQWHKETQDLIWNQSIVDNLVHLINGWFTMLVNEEVVEKRIVLETVILAPSQTELFISFDRSPFTKEQSTREKWLLIEGLLRTIRENNLNIQKVNFLVRHEPLHDPHLDFSRAWPIVGFLNENKD